ncbi:LPS export ABC transporter periplasmic protein LptC [Leptospira langatensis]|uniref:LPS export ABC transporter periplasmic protein LptC n=1 Tax=Leptospira langatensis TaxID=2484983 RepID=A0A5F1ZYF7_9LEPT|nr:LPS export ABC transporter periplasmic protein LptC [Leptospira langatensis]TGK04238.1 LPS export ABC transporter periplasmic protein LptC [Leptospira langatensis]TGL43718.1 LPS export ABC transporter periplasmic protein LptC [Leptospira langatensis]
MFSPKKFLQELDKETVQKYGPPAALGLVVLIILIYFSVGGKPDAKYSRVEGEREQGSTVSFKNFQKDQYDENGTLLWKLKAEEAYLFSDKKMYILYGVDFDQYENGKFKSKITGDKGVINQSEKSMELQGNIFLRTDENRTLKAKSLHYNDETKELTSNEEVVINASGTYIRGVGLKADKDLNKFTIIRPTAITQGGANPLSSTDK